MKEKHPPYLGLAAILACEIIFGLSYIFTKTATDVASSLALLGWRFSIALLVFVLLLATKVIRIQLKGRSIRILVFMGFMFPIVYFVGETGGIALTSASESGTFIAAVPIFSLLASTILLKERPKRQQVIGIAVTLFGVLVTVLSAGLSASFSLTGYALLTMALLSYAIYSVLVEKYTIFTGLEITFMMLLLGALVFSSLAIGEAIWHKELAEFLLLPIRNRDFLIAVLYQGIACSILAFFFSNYAIAQIGVNQTASFVGISTAVSIFAGVLFLGEPFTPVQFIGAALILAGVYIANSQKAQ